MYMMKFNKKVPQVLAAILIMMSLVACSSQSNQANKQIIENIDNELDDGVIKTNLAEDYGLKEFDIYELQSNQNNSYTFLRFKNPVVANRKGNNYYSQSSVHADMSVTIIEDDDYTNNTMQEVIDKSTSYIQDIIKSQYQEDGNIAYKFINYKMYGEDKGKFVICVNTETGYIVHDFSYFTNVTPEDAKLIKSYIEDIYISFGIT